MNRTADYRTPPSRGASRVRKAICTVSLITRRSIAMIRFTRFVSRWTATWCFHTSAAASSATSFSAPAEIIALNILAVSSLLLTAPIRLRHVQPDRAPSRARPAEHQRPAAFAKGIASSIAACRSAITAGRELSRRSGAPDGSRTASPPRHGDAGDFRASSHRSDEPQDSRRVNVALAMTVPNTPADKPRFEVWDPGPLLDDAVRRSASAAACRGSQSRRPYRNCTALRRDHPKGVPRGHCAYQRRMDRDNDGRACER